MYTSCGQADTLVSNQTLSRGLWRNLLPDEHCEQRHRDISCFSGPLAPWGQQFRWDHTIFNSTISDSIRTTIAPGMSARRHIGSGLSGLTGWRSRSLSPPPASGSWYLLTAAGLSVVPRLTCSSSSSVSRQAKETSDVILLPVEVALGSLASSAGSFFFRQPRQRILRLPLTRHSR